jgi:myo-inositol 2-dehydrogenase / D-chiro-inositol 1-dehydrogenase
VDDSHCFSGLSLQAHVIEASDVVLIACAAKFHPMYLMAAVQAGRHVFAEKPVHDELPSVPEHSGL